MKNKSLKFVLVVLCLSLATVTFSRKLTTKQMRETTIRINALEVKTMEDLGAKYPITIIKDPEKDPEGPVVAFDLDEKMLFFDFDKSAVKPEYYSLLRDIASVINANDYKVSIIGHTDSTGADAYNQGLSERRSAAVRAKLIEFGVSSYDLTSSGKGEKEPIASNANAGGRAQNRRIEFKVYNK